MWCQDSTRSGPGRVAGSQSVSHLSERRECTRAAPRPNDGTVDWLLDCPTKGFFVPIDSESTDTL